MRRLLRIFPRARGRIELWALGLLNVFNRWFVSPEGVWQTFLLVFVAGVVEIADRRLDPHGFWLLWLLTLYSAVTQPALAYSSNEGSARLLVVINDLLSTMALLVSVAERLQSFDEATQGKLDRILDALKEDE